MKHILIFLLGLTNLTLSAQNNDIWTLFWNSDTTLFGYKDKNGTVKIEPKFTMVFADKFNHIIAVTKEVNSQWDSYYLTKSGKIVGRDSLYFFDNGFDCENEGFIRFRDHKIDKAGLFNKNGDIVIPAEYDDLTGVRNGMFIALKGAKKEYWDDSREHYSWVGGQEMLIDTLNRVLIDRFPYATNLNFYSIQKTKTPPLDTIREFFPAKDGSYYSFINFEKEFKQWLTTDLLSNLTAEKLIKASFDTITWASIEDWEKSDSRQFITNNFDMLKKGLQEILNPDCNYFISMDGLNSYIYEGTEFEKYFNDCGETKEWIYPVMAIIVSHKNKKDFTQNHYEFLRTDNGYKLISITVRNEKIND